ncbi:Aspartate aminotransferase [Metallosphaera sp. J1]|uniref:histidinol-phosphate transaminase n=1 Tax=Metallosphaera javensis (ex Hofmann et al. 2022) TaxID=99938 RepID=UPI001EDFBECB|nr:histidinol-phosphate transaminase [Metallosphaera javensis (ex Hofmann et al. 2022)]MCG3108678.1 Aspartate aminotransferase [Metallosphaera javensis (ex Hofmann et al. 2022)]
MSRGILIAPTDVKDIIYPWLKEAKEYDFSDIKDGIRLHLNESPYSPPDFVLDAVKKYLVQGNRYQHPDLTKRFKELAAEYNRVEPEEIFPTPGGDGAIRSVFLNLSMPGDRVVLNQPSYSMYSVYSSFRGLNQVRVPLKEEGDWWKEDWEKLVKEVRDARLVAIDDPNNPTGSPMIMGDEGRLRELVETTKGIVLLDEAYYEFSGYTASRLVSKYPNLMIVRTMSKAFSLASFRVGYLIANRDVVKALEKGSTPFDVALPSLVAGITALENPGYARRIAQEISENREELYRGLVSLGMKTYRSITNFLLFRHSGELVEPLMKRGVAIRNPVRGFYRVSVGTREQCRIFLDKLGEVLENSNTEQG